MTTSKNQAIVFICASVCGKDGLISHSELAELKSCMWEYLEIPEQEFDIAMDAFFNSSEEVDFYVSQITPDEDRIKVLKIAEKSASVDGLDVRENIGFQRLKLIWDCM